MSQQVPRPEEQARAAELTRKVAGLRKELDKLPAARREAFRTSLEADEATEREQEPEG